MQRIETPVFGWLDLNQMRFAPDGSGVNCWLRGALAQESQGLDCHSR